MARRFLTDIELLGFSLLNARLHPVSVNPSGLGVGDAGRVWYNSTTNRFMVWNGTAAIDALSRANHTGTQLASTISDLAATVQAYAVSSFGAATANLNVGGFKITNAGDGTAGSDVATYGQLLQFLNNQSFKTPVRAATTANITLSGVQTIDTNVTLVAGDRVLVKDQTTPATNGIYTVAAGTWPRAEDFNTSAEAVPGSVVAVQEGTVNVDKLFMLFTNGPITLGTTALSFQPYGASSGEIGVAGAGLTKTGVTYDVGAAVDGTVTVTADAVGVNTARVLRKWVGVIPTVSATVDGITITVAGAVVTFNHATGNICPTVELRYGTAGVAPGQKVEADDVASDANNVAITLPSAPVLNQLTFMVAA